MQQRNVFKKYYRLTIFEVTKVNVLVKVVSEGRQLSYTSSYVAVFIPNKCLNITNFYSDYDLEGTYFSDNLYKIIRVIFIKQKHNRDQIFPNMFIILQDVKRYM